MISLESSGILWFHLRMSQIKISKLLVNKTTTTKKAARVTYEL
jgi:hypothetical protein